MAQLGQSIPQPERGWNRFDDDLKESIYYSEEFTTLYRDEHSEWKNTVTQTTTAGSIIRFKFKGIGVRILNTAAHNSSKSIIRLDGTQYDVGVPVISLTSQALFFEKISLSNVEHTLEIETLQDDKYFALDCIDILEGGILPLIPELSRDYEFPLGIIEETDLQEFAEECINGEEQLLITRKGKLFLTNGSGGYIKAGGADADPNSHIHTNEAQLNKIGESANMLTYNGKVVVNDNEYSFRSLPRAKVVNNYSTSKGGRLPWLT